MAGNFLIMTSVDILTTALTGLGAGFALIIAIGAQNAFVLRQGIRGEHVFLVVAVCTISDIVLIAAGILGIGEIIKAAPVVVVIIRWAGAAFLLGYALLAAKRALRPGVLKADGRTGAISAKVALVTVLTLTWLNPHVYLDTVLLLGSLANQHGDLRWWFGAGTALASIIWFAALGYGARYLRPIFAKPSAWRVLDGIIAVVMFLLALKMAFGA